MHQHQHNTAPVAKRVPHTIEVGGRKLDDPYFWLRDDSRQKQEVLDYLQSENHYTEAMMQHTKPLQQALFEEMMSHEKEDETRCPYPSGPFLYYSRDVPGQNYRVYCRKPRPLSSTAVENDKGEGKENEVLVDVNRLSEGHKFFDLVWLGPSPCHRYVMYLVDTVGNERHRLYIKDVKEDRVLVDGLPDVDSAIWGADATTIYYTTRDAAQRPYKLFRRQSLSAIEDECLYTELDELLWLHLYKSESGRFLFLRAAGQITAEVWYLNLQAADNKEHPKLTCIRPRERGVLYKASDVGDNFWFITDDQQCRNFRLAYAPIANPAKEKWQNVIEYNPAMKIGSMTVFKTHVAVSCRFKGYNRVMILPLEHVGDNHSPVMSSAVENVEFKYDTALIRKPYMLRFPEEISNVGFGENEEFDIGCVRVRYQSFTTPTSTFDFNVCTGELTLLHEKSVPNYDRTKYRSRRMTAKSSGIDIPMSVVYRRDLQRDKFNTVFLWGYGAYGLSYEPDFDAKLLPLLDRGLVIVFAHIRGGGEGGRPWHDAGKMLNKKNTFNDFIACAEHLIRTDFTRPSQLAICGGSAGGLLMGAVINMRPDLFRVCYTRVPYVDVIATMSDPALPLTVVEYEEWGNPENADYYDYMLSYSPMDNIKEQAYPAVLATSGLHDTRVCYWEPTKWIARLRHSATSASSNVILHKCKLQAGHVGSSGKYVVLEERSFEYAFVLDQLGITK